MGCFETTAFVGYIMVYLQHLTGKCDLGVDDRLFVLAKEEVSDDYILKSIVVELLINIENIGGG